MGLSQKLYVKGRKMIPGGTQLLTKRPEMYLPGNWPAYYEKAKGCRVWDLDGKEYIDTSYMGIGACILGYADEVVDIAVKNAVDKGSMATLNCPEEVELAELLCRIHPWAGMVRYARTGGEAMAISVRIARAGTGKDIVLFCGYHGWHDWYLAANLADDKALDGHLLPGLEPKGVPRGLKGTSFPFKYNDTVAFFDLIKKYGDNVAAVVMEPIRSVYPEKDFLDAIRETTAKKGIVLIIDEITAGWKLNFGGAHLSLGITPDIAVFAKAISNGYPMAAVLGKSGVMDAVQDTFISSTYWTEKIGPAAALATIKQLEEKNVAVYLNNIGKKIQDGWKKLVAKHGLKLNIGGIFPLSHFTFDHEEPLVLKTLFVQEMLKKGFLATIAFYASYAHGEKDVEKYLAAADEVFFFLSKAVKKGDPSSCLEGKVCHGTFKRLV